MLASDRRRKPPQRRDSLRRRLAGAWPVCTNYGPGSGPRLDGPARFPPLSLHSPAGRTARGMGRVVPVRCFHGGIATAHGCGRSRAETMGQPRASGCRTAAHETFDRGGLAKDRQRGRRISRPVRTQPRTDPFRLLDRSRDAELRADAAVRRGAAEGHRYPPEGSLGAAARITLRRAPRAAPARVVTRLGCYSGERTALAGHDRRGPARRGREHGVRRPALSGIS